MLTRTDQPERDECAERLRALIAEGGYAPGDRIPPERQLIEMMGITRAGLRRALDFLERDGVIWRHVGKGTFVSYGATDAVTEDAFAGIGNQLSPYRMMRARICVEPAIAREAAVYASREQVARIDAAAKRARAAASWSEYERQDDQFHRAVAEAADNALLLALFDSLNRVRREVAWGAVTRSNARPPRDHSSFAEHDAICAALAAHDADAAFQAMRAHLQSVSSRLFEGI
ncbi:transcriptional regulator, GntR family (plasmid) [Dinoroseobacter shibae DFL 12 = DSM 16493]|uniref:Transcriptional regulator, GntR family n=1 Tax=Dinoroseobacter shibae (strain DSM 16493 / NCIMB 14021 / DFL 12) TaxID=398580 RepID=A8LUH8_DINSH|nr:FCD domain-containing protein [Dinoroseobacter shibae]ABV95895.1 transcriptional regulator, GntR family [Dinoroseobacter shibae DFL 12 = DSM 16493]URF49210.1 FCD domain-containing protein [Dinoroseobacter shibae]URF53518.1 FCD domain-containing protein [Dinoroseobacter shibae]